MTGLLLRPLEYIYSLVTRTRNFLYDSSLLPAYKCSIPVISVGNITAGGTGKTPLCIFIAAELTRYRYNPVVLAKGYKGRIRGPHRVTLSDSAEEVGDEALLFALHAGCPVVISRDKTEGARFIERERIGDIIVLDDGFQHRKLHRDLDIVCIDASSSESIHSFVRGRLLPAGRLRENRDRALRRAQIIVLSRRHSQRNLHAEIAQLRKVLPARTSFFESIYVPEPVRALDSERQLDPCAVVAVSGIANPGGFKDLLASMGFAPHASYAFSDHERNIGEKILDVQKRHPGLPIVCTEKDAVKLRQGIQGVYILPVRASLVQPQNVSFMDLALTLMQDPSLPPPGAYRLIAKGPSRQPFENLQIETGRLRLSPIETIHAEEILHEFTDEITRYMTPPTPKDISEPLQFIELSKKRLREGRDIVMGVFSKESGEFLGCCGLHEKSDALHPELGIWIKKGAHGKKFGFEAVKAMSDWADRNLRYEYLVYPVDRRNIASRKIAEGLGGAVFTEKTDVTADGRTLEVVVYKIPHRQKFLETDYNSWRQTMPSFDVASQVDIQEVRNAVDQVQREISTRYDFKGSQSSVELEPPLIKIHTEDKMKLNGIQTLLREKLAKRGVSLKSVVFKDPVPAGGDTLKQEVTVKEGLSDDELKRLNKIIKNQKVKVSSQIQGNQLRVSGKKRDDLQQIIALLKAEVADLDLQFINFRE